MTMPIHSSMVTTLSSGTITSRKLVSWNTAMSAVHVKLRTRYLVAKGLENKRIATSV